MSDRWHATPDEGVWISILDVDGVDYVGQCDIGEEPEPGHDDEWLDPAIEMGVVDW